SSRSTRDTRSSPRRGHSATAYRTSATTTSSAPRPGDGSGGSRALAQAGRPGVARGTSPEDGEHLPFVGDPLQDVLPPVLEGEARADDEVLDRPGHEHLARAGEGGDPGADVDGQPADVV